MYQYTDDEGEVVTFPDDGQRVRVIAPCIVRTPATDTEWVLGAEAEGVVHSSVPEWHHVCVEFEPEDGGDAVRAWVDPDNLDFDHHDGGGGGAGYNKA